MGKGFLWIQWEHLIHCGDHMREEPKGKEEDKERISNEELHEEQLWLGSKLREKLEKQSKVNICQA